MIVYSFQKLVIEPYEAFDVVSAGTVNFSKQKILVGAIIRCGMRS